MWAVGQEKKPARNFSEGDRFIAATAIFPDHVSFATDLDARADGRNLLGAEPSPPERSRHDSTPELSRWAVA
jgi:hypothetical protein